jgi:L-malate glycosyltransferase
MRVLILTPTAFPTISGNAMTVERWRQALNKKGLCVEVIASEGLDPLEFQQQWQRIRPDIIHVHHAFKAGRLLLHPRIVQQSIKAAIVVSPGGTDINEDIAQPEKQKTVLQIFQMARIFVIQNPVIIPRFRQFFPDPEKKIVYIPKAVCWFGDEAYDLRKIAACNPDDFLFLLPAGVRPVKGNLECLELMRRVHKLRPQIRFVAAGPAIDDAYAQQFAQKISELSYFALWIKTIPAAAMRSVYRASDIAVNFSSSEGLANSLMEAIAAGRPVLASDIAGNRWPILGEDGDAPAGLLFDLHQPDDFVEKALELIDKEELRTSFSQAASARQSRWYNPEMEADALMTAYQSALQ